MEGNYPNPRKICSDVSSEVEIFEKLVKAVKRKKCWLFSDMKHWEIYSNFPMEVILITF